jgi:hypothetical protein
VPEAGPEFYVFTLGENQSTEAVTVSHGTPRYKGGGLSSPYCLVGAFGSEHHRLAKIKPDEHRTIPFLSKNLGMRFPRARSNAPVNGTQIVTGLIRTGFVKFDTSTFEPRYVPPSVQCTHA